jgi:hypothetical protein
MGELIFECSFIKIRATVGDAKSQSQGETEEAAARFRSDHIRCFPEGNGSQAEYPPVGAAQLSFRSREVILACSIVVRNKLKAASLPCRRKDHRQRAPTSDQPQCGCNGLPDVTNS